MCKPKANDSMLGGHPTTSNIAAEEQTQGLQSEDAKKTKQMPFAKKR